MMMVYSFNTISYGPKRLVLGLNKVRSYIGAHHGEPDERIEDILLQACEDTENKLGSFYIMPQVVEMIHKRSDILIRKGPVQEILSVHLKEERNWREIFNARDNQPPSEVAKIFSEYPQNNGTRWIRLQNWRENQQVKVTYKAGYWDDESPHKLPYSVQECILTRCYQIYTMSHGTKEFREMQSDMLAGMKENRISLL